MKGGWGKASPFHLPVENNSTSRLDMSSFQYSIEILFILYFYSYKETHKI